MSPRREPVRLGDLVAGIAGRLGLGDPSTWAVIRAEWATIVEPPWDVVTVPVSLHDGVLVVEVLQPGGVAMLRYAQATIERRLAERLGEGVVGEVRFRASQSGALPGSVGEED